MIRSFLKVLLSGVALVPLGAPSAVGQAQYRFQQLGSRQGRTFPEVAAIAQDSLGFLWFSHNRWDGEEFKAFDQDPTDSLAAVGFVWDALTVTGDGRVWLGTDEGLSVFDYELGGFREVPLPAAEDGQKPWVQNIVEAADGHLWIGSWGAGVYRYDPVTGRVRVYRSDPDDARALSHNSVYAIIVDSNTDVWIGTEAGGLNRYDAETDDFQQFRSNTEDPSSLCDDRVRSLAEDALGRVWVGTYASGVCILDADRQEFSSLPADLVPHSHIVSILHDREQRTWLGSEAGLVLILDDELVEVFIAQGHKDSLAGSSIKALAEDAQGTIWIGTSLGISYLDARRQQITTIPGPRGAPEIVAARALEEWGGEIWVGSEKSGLYSLQTDAPGLRLRYSFPDLPSKTINDLASQGDILWIATSNGLVRLDSNGSLLTYGVGGGETDGLTSNVVMSLLIDHEGVLWLMTDDETLHRMSVLGEFDHWTRNELVPNSRYDLSWMINLEEHASEPGILWIGTFRDGLVRFDPESGKSTSYHKEEGDDQSLSGHAVFSSWSDAPGDLWLATGVGLAHVKLDPEHGISSLTQWFEADGLSSDIVRSITPAPDGALWLGTENGLNRFDRTTGVIKKVTSVYGAPETLYWQGASLVTSDGALVLGSRGGVSLIRTEELDFAESGAPVRFTKLEVLGQERVLAPSIEVAQEVVLRHDENFLGISFASLNLGAATSSGYRYKMEGVDPVWTDAGRRTHASYPNLGPGRFSFRVEAVGADGALSTATIAVTVLPAWWRTTLAISMWIVMALATAWGGVHLRIRALQRRTNELASEVEIRTSELADEKRTAEAATAKVSRQAEDLRKLGEAQSNLFANISHEFRTPLTLIDGPLADALNESDSPQVFMQRGVMERMGRQARRLTGLVDQLLEVSRIEANRITFDLEHGDLRDVLGGLVGVHQSASERRSQQLSYRCDSVMPQWFDRVKLGHIVSNLVSNAQKYTPTGGRIDVVVKRSNGSCEIIVQDTGTGISEADLGRVFDRFFRASLASSRILPGIGIGLSLVRDLVQAHGGTVSVSSVIGRGSCFKVRLPTWTEVPDLPGVFIKTEGDTESMASVALEQSFSTGDGQAGQLGTANLVLVVDDNDDIRAYLRESLAGIASIAEAVDGKQGLKMAEELAPDVIVSDVMMPGMDGFEMVSRLRANPSLDLTPVVLLTARAEDSDAEAGFLAGADAYVAKPFSSQVLRAQVTRLIARQRSQRARLASPASFPDDGLGDDSLVRKARELVLGNLASRQYGVEELAGDLAMSPRNLHRKLKEACSVGPQVFIRTIRLFHAEKKLRQDGSGVAEVAAEVGYSTTKHFRAHFRRQFGVLPGEV